MSAEAALRDAFRLWLHLLEVDPLFVGTFREHIDAHAEKALSAAPCDTKLCMFLSIVAFKQGKLPMAARLFMAGGKDARLHDTDFFELVQAGEDGSPVMPLHIALMTGAPDVYERVLAAMQLQVDMSDEDVREDEVSASGAAASKRARGPLSLLALAAYVFQAVRTTFGDEYRVQKALYWANAAWVYLHGIPLVPEEPLAYQNGPLYQDVYMAVKRWKNGAIDDLDPTAVRDRGDADAKAILDAAIDHVRKGSWKEVCDESHEELPWKSAGWRQPITKSMLIDAYGGGKDETGAIRRIFGTVMRG